MVFSAPLRILLLCLLHFSTRAVSEDVDLVTLQQIITKFHDNLGEGQYTVVFRVERDKCLQHSDFPEQSLLDRVRDTIQNNRVYQSNDLIAAKVDKGSNQHSEYRLKNYLKNIVNVSDQCVVYFTVNSPCLSRCLNLKNPKNIKASLTQLQNYAGIKALAFRNFFRWKDGSDERQDVIKRLKEIAPALPYYQCKESFYKCDRL